MGNDQSRPPSGVPLGYNRSSPDALDHQYTSTPLNSSSNSHPIPNQRKSSGPKQSPNKPKISTSVNDISQEDLSKLDPKLQEWLSRPQYTIVSQPRASSPAALPQNSPEKVPSNNRSSNPETGSQKTSPSVTKTYKRSADGIVIIREADTSGDMPDPLLLQLHSLPILEPIKSSAGLNNPSDRTKSSSNSSQTEGNTNSRTSSNSSRDSSSHDSSSSSSSISLPVFTDLVFGALQSSFSKPSGVLPPQFSGQSFGVPNQHSMEMYKLLQLYQVRLNQSSLFICDTQDSIMQRVGSAEILVHKAGNQTAKIGLMLNALETHISETWNMQASIQQLTHKLAIQIKRIDTVLNSIENPELLQSIGPLPYVPAPYLTHDYYVGWHYLEQTSYRTMLMAPQKANQLQRAQLSPTRSDVSHTSEQQKSIVHSDSELQGGDSDSGSSSDYQSQEFSPQLISPSASLYFQHLSQLEMIWVTDILPFWDTMITTKRAKKLWRLGIPPRLRGFIWKKAVGNALGISSDYFESFVQRRKSGENHQLEADLVNIRNESEISDTSKTTSSSDDNSDESFDVSTENNEMVLQAIEYSHKVDSENIETSLSISTESETVINTTSSQPTTPPSEVLESTDEKSNITSDEKNSEEIKSENLEKAELPSQRPVSRKSAAMIARDVMRTFSKITIFRNVGGQPYEDLLNILLASSELLPHIGYVQGQSYIAGTLLLYLPASEAFVTFCNMLEQHMFRSFSSFNLAAIHLHVHAYKLLFAENVPKLQKKFNELQLEPEYYLLDWYITLFSKSFSIPSAGILWDCYLLEGPLIVPIIICLVLQYYESRLLNFTFEEAIEFMQKLPEDLPLLELLKRVDSINVPSSVQRLFTPIWNERQKRPLV